MKVRTLLAALSLALGALTTQAADRLDRTVSADETADVGIDLATPVVEAMGSGSKSKFTGRIPRVTIEVK